MSTLNQAYTLRSNGTATSNRFEAPAVATATQVSIGHHGNMPNLSGGTQWSKPQFIVEYQPTANTGAECKKYKVALLKALLEKGKNGRLIQVGKYTHDTACTLKEMEGSLCDKMFLDAYFFVNFSSNF